MENISKKEWILGIASLFIVVGLAIALKRPIENNFLEKIKTYEQSLKVKDDSDMFIYAHKTNVGNVLAYGEFVALQPQSIPELINKYAIIEKRLEEYNMHTREVCTSDGEGHTTCHTEIYYEWDYEGSKWYNTSNYQFLTYIFLTNELSSPPLSIQKLSEETVNQQFLKKVSGLYLYPNGIGSYLGNQRYQYRIIPKKFMGSMFIRFFNDSISNPINPKSKIEIFYEKNIDEVLILQNNNAIAFNILYYIFFILIGMGIYFFVAYNIFEI